MNAKIPIFAASAIACLTSGCIVPAPYYEPVAYGRPVAVVPGDEIILPSVLIVEHGVRHDRAFYRRHPEYYRRDRMRYPDLFVAAPHHDHDRYRGPVAPAYHAPVYHGPAAASQVVVVRPGAPGEQRPEDPKAKKKKKHDDKDHDNRDH